MTRRLASSLCSLVRVASMARGLNEDNVFVMKKSHMNSMELDHKRVVKAMKRWAWSVKEREMGGQAQSPSQKGRVFTLITRSHDHREIFQWYSAMWTVREEINYYQTLSSNILLCSPYYLKKYLFFIYFKMSCTHRWWKLLLSTKFYSLWLRP